MSQRLSNEQIKATLIYVAGVLPASKIDLAYDLLDALARVNELERERDEANPMLEAARRQAVIGWEVPPCLSGEVYRLWIAEWTARYLKVCGETDAVIGYDAARAAGDEE